MHRPTRSTSGLILLLGAVLALGACGGGGSPAATGGGGATTAPAGAATTAPGGEATTAPAGEATPAPVEPGEDINLGAAASALDDLDNYRFRMVMAASNGAEFIMVSDGGSMTMEGAVIFRPEPAADITITTEAADGTKGVMGYRILGSKSYVTMDGEQWIASDEADPMKAIESYKPEAMLGSFSSVSGLTRVGDEDKNGIPTTHYRSEEDAGYASMFGLPDGTWTMDVWVARDGGFVVATAATATAKAGADAGSFSMTVDILGANEPGLTVEKPENLLEF